MTCSQPNCTRAVYAGGMCRPCRHQAIGGLNIAYSVGDVRMALNRITEHYPSVMDAIRATGISHDSYYRIRKSDDGARVKGPTARRILEHVKNLPEPVVKSDPNVISRSEVAAYARTKEGRAFIAKCRAPRRVA